MLSAVEIEWDSGFNFSYRWLEYTGHEGDPENPCNCSAILQSDPQSIEQAKLLSLTQDFRHKFIKSNDYYKNATMDCRWAVLEYDTFKEP